MILSSTSSSHLPGEWADALLYSDSGQKGTAREEKAKQIIG